MTLSAPGAQARNHRGEECEQIGKCQQDFNGSQRLDSSWLPELLRERRYDRASQPAAQGHEPDEDRTVEEQRECWEAEQRTSADPAFTTGSLE